MEGDVFVRYLSFKDKGDMKKHIMAKQPHKIDIGAVFSAPVRDTAHQQPGGREAALNWPPCAAIKTHNHEERGLFHRGARTGV